VSTTKSLMPGAGEGLAAPDGVLESLPTVDDWERAARDITSPVEWDFTYGDLNSPDWSTYAKRYPYTIVAFWCNVLIWHLTSRTTKLSGSPLRWHA
jgi:hypothetical protein